MVVLFAYVSIWLQFLCGCLTYLYSMVIVCYEVVLLVKINGIVHASGCKGGGFLLFTMYLQVIYSCMIYFIPSIFLSLTKLVSLSQLVTEVCGSIAYALSML